MVVLSGLIPKYELIEKVGGVPKEVVYEGHEQRDNKLILKFKANNQPIRVRVPHNLDTCRVEIKGLFPQTMENSNDTYEFRSDLTFFKIKPGLGKQERKNIKALYFENKNRKNPIILVSVSLDTFDGYKKVYFYTANAPKVVSWARNKIKFQFSI